MKITMLAFAAMIAGSLFGASRTEAIREKLASGDRDYVFVAMHRGDWRNFPENSKGAILSAIRLGADRLLAGIIPLFERMRMQRLS